jgi:tetratricopeptide (TPR) repeat protein
MKHYTILIFLLLTSSIVFSQSGAEYFFEGNYKYDLEDYRGAILNYSKAIEINPNYADAYNFRGRAKGQLQDYRGAIADHSKAIEINPNYADAYQNRGIFKIKLEDYGGAMADLSKAIEINPNTAAYSNRGNLKIKLEDFEGAIADLSIAIAINPNSEASYFLRGLAKLILGQIDSGCLDLSKAGELGYFDAYDVIKEYCN